MSYITKADLIARFGRDELTQLTDRDRSGVIDDLALDAAIADAGGLIDSYIGGRYALPISQPVPILTRYAGDLVRYFLFDDRATDEVIRRYDDVVAYLGKVSSGKVQLGINASGGKPPTHSNHAQMTGPGRVFGRDT